MLAEDLRGIISDAVASASLSENQAVAAILRRVNGASAEQLIAAAVAVMREQARRIDTDAVDREFDLRTEMMLLEVEIDELRAALKELHP